MVTGQHFDAIEMLPAKQKAKIRSHQESGCVRLGPILSDLGIACRLVEMDAEVSGESFYAHGYSPSGFVISVNVKHIVERQRFTTAHEIGHCLLHPEYVKDRSGSETLFSATNRSSLGGRSVGFGIVENDPFADLLAGDERLRERQADQFASHLLMPARLMNKAARAGWRSKTEMAAKLWVSEGALQRRLLELSS